MGTGSKVIANLNSGGTNPYVLHKVRVEVKQCTALHANVYVGRNHAVVSSSNVSIEALGLEGFGQAGWIEAGVLLGQVERAGKWFDELWSFGSSVITDAQWKEAERLWDLRETSHNPSSPASLTLKPARQTFLL